MRTPRKILLSISMRVYNRLMKSLTVLLLAGVGFAADRLTVEKAIQVREPSDLHFSPDGKQVALTLQEPPVGRGSLRHVWIYDVASA